MVLPKASGREEQSTYWSGQVPVRGLNRDHQLKSPQSHAQTKPSPMMPSARSKHSFSQRRLLFCSNVE